jgi:hypothetical protein
VAALVAGCAAPPPAPRLHAAPASYLLGIDQLVSPDFTLDSAPHPLTAAAIAASGGTAQAQLAAARMTSAAAEDFFRSTPILGVLNGPVQVADTVEEFDSAGGATTVYSADLRRLDAQRGSAPVSTGSLGDAAHAFTRTANTADGTMVVEITVEWRVDNLLDLLVVRGRFGAVRLDDALLLAHRQTVSELGLQPSTPSASPASPASP